MNEIRMIPIGDLEHHPENPRKNLGDLTELAESIKANGVMQNLTVVADIEKAKYLVVIGNRRLEAAKIVGLPDLPCVISNMDYKTQIATMLMENMQRQDLTVFEQSQGFQMMMDLGFSAKEISEKTGFSEKTVKDRIRFTKFNQKHFESAVANGATLTDMIEISKLESKVDQNEVMKEAGTNNFRQMLNRKLGEQKFRKNCEQLGKIAAEEGLEQIPEGTNVWGNYDSLGTPTGTYESDEKIRKIIRKTVKGSDGTQLFYQFIRSWDSNDAKLAIYRKKEQGTKELSEEEKEQKEKDRERQKHLREVKKLWAEAYQLRTDFVRNYTVTNGFGMTTIGKLIARYALSQQVYWGEKKLTESHQWKDRYIRNVLGIQPEEYEDKKSIWELAEARGTPMIRSTLAWIMGGGVFDCDLPDYGRFNYYDGHYETGNSQGMLTERYEFLKEIGYEMSDMERQLMDGTHPVYEEAKKK